MAKEKIRVTCDGCGKNLLRRPDHIKRYKNSFCDANCRGKWQVAKRVEVSCLQCGTPLFRTIAEIKSHKAGHFFCNRECKITWETRNTATVACANCGKTCKKNGTSSKRNVRGHFFCSMTCLRATQASERVSVPCHHCGKTTEQAPADFKTSKTGKFFCNMVCLRAWEITATILVNCEECGKEFERLKSQASKQKHQFCDKNCQGKWKGRQQQGENHPQWKADRPLVRCAMCDKEFRPKWGSFKRNAHHFCDQKCVAQWRSIYRTGENSASWRGGHPRYYGPDWYRQMRAARERDGYKCRHCGITQKKARRALDVHHIEPFRTFGYILNHNENYKQANDLTNLITLCPQCHAKAEAHMIAIQPALLSA